MEETPDDDGLAPVFAEVIPQLFIGWYVAHYAREGEKKDDNSREGQRRRKKERVSNPMNQRDSCHSLHRSLVSLHISIKSVDSEALKANNITAVLSVLRQMEQVLPQARHIYVCVRLKWTDFPRM